MLNTAVNGSGGGGDESVSLVGTNGREDEKSISGQALPRVPTNMPTNEPPLSTIDKRHEERQIKRGWIEWPAHETKQYGKRRYPRHREWLWDEEKHKWIKSNPVYNYRPDLKPMNEVDYVKYAERRDKARKLGY